MFCPVLPDLIGRVNFTSRLGKAVTTRLSQILRYSPDSSPLFLQLAPRVDNFPSCTQRNLEGQAKVLGRRKNMRRNSIPERRFRQWGQLVAESLLSLWPPCPLEENSLSYNDCDNLNDHFITVRVRFVFEQYEIDCNTIFAKMPQRFIPKTSMSNAEQRSLKEAKLGDLEMLFKDLNQKLGHDFAPVEDEVDNWVVYEAELIIPALHFQTARPRITLRCGEICKLPIFTNDRWDGPIAINNKKLNRELDNLYSSMKNDLES